jgi:hypothetical protein
MDLPQNLRNIVAIKYVARMHSDKTNLPGKSRLWVFKQRPLGLDCAWQGCGNEPIHVDARGIAFCLNHCERGE